MMKAWDVDIDGIGYLVAARSEAEAIGAVLLLEKESGLAWEDHQIREHTDLRTMISGDGEPDESIGSLLSGLQEPEVIGCSEWP